MYKYTLLFGLLICFALPATAQSYLGIEFNYMQPLHEYGKNLEVHPKGFGLSYMYKPQIFQKFYIGAQLGVSMYATDSYNESVRNKENERVNIEINEEDCFVSYGLIGRYFLIEDRLINPYIEARLGGLSFFSTKMTDDEHDEYFENSTTFYGTTIQLGLGGGFSYHVKDNLWIDLNMVYNRGGRADYRNIGASDAVHRANAELGKFESYTDNFNYSLGVLFGF